MAVIEFEIWINITQSYIYIRGKIKSTVCLDFDILIGLFLRNWILDAERIYYLAATISLLRKYLEMQYWNVLTRIPF